MSLVESELARRKALGTFHGSFQCQPHSLAYRFDCSFSSLREGWPMVSLLFAGGNVQ